MMDFFFVFSRGCKSPSLIILKYYDRQIVHRCGKARLSSLVFLFLKKNIITLRPNSTRCSLKEAFLIPSFSSQAHVVETVHSCRNVEVEQQTKRVDQRSSPSEYTQDTARMQMSATPPKKSGNITKWHNCFWYAVRSAAAVLAFCFHCIASSNRGFLSVVLNIIIQIK